MASPSLTLKSTPDSGWRELPPIVNEALVQKFSYWNGKLQVGMRYGVDIYRQLQSYSIDERLKAWDLACEHTAQGAKVCITASKTGYLVWLDMRSVEQAAS